MAENEVLAEGTEVEDSSKTPGDEGKETAVDELTKIFNNYESDVKGKMLSKYFSKALVEAGITLPEAEVRDLTFLADPKSCGWILKEDFLKVMEIGRNQKEDTQKLKDQLSKQFKGGEVSLDELVELLKGVEGFDAAIEEELKQLMESFQQGESDYKKDEKKVDLDRFIQSLLHPENKGSGSPLDNVSINLAQ